MTKRFLAIVTVLILALTSVVAFAEAETTETASVDWTEPYAEPVEVHICIEEPANAVFAEGEDYSNNLWTKRWKELYNVNVIVDWVSNEYDTKMNLSIASNTLPDIYKVNAVQFSQLKQAGALQDLTETYNTYASDSIKTMMENNWDIVETAMEGDQILAMPRLHYGYECETTQIWARSDWMEQSGVTEFTSVDDVVNVMKGFQENNSASYGIMLDKSLDCFFRSAVMFHALPKIWVEGEDGSLVYGSVQPEMKEALSTWAQWYQDGLIRQDFGTLDNAAMLEDAYNGKAGLYFSGNWAGWSVGRDMVNNQGDGSYFIAYDVPSVDGEKAMMPVQFNNFSYHVVSAGYEHPEILLKLTNDYCYVLNDSITEGGMTLEEVIPFNSNEMHHITGPFKVEIASYTDCMDVYNAFQTGEENFHSGYGHIYYNEAKLWTENGDTTGLGRYLQMGIPNGGMVIGCKHVDNEQIQKDAMWGLKPQTVLDYGSTLDDLLVEGFTQIIMGVESVDYFDTLVENWKMAGGDQVTQAVNEMYGA